MPEYSERFKERARSLYESIRKRAKEKRKKNNRVISQGYPIPFTTEQFRQWLLAQFGGTEGGVTRCAYCNRPIDVYNCAIDHEKPLKRGGSPDLHNLIACCASDNDIKGQLTGEEYRAFICLLREMEMSFGPAPVRNITARLESQTKLAAMNRREQVRQVKEKAREAERVMEDF